MKKILFVAILMSMPSAIHSAELSPMAQAVAKMKAAQAERTEEANIKALPKVEVKKSVTQTPTKAEAFCMDMSSEMNSEEYGYKCYHIVYNYKLKTKFESSEWFRAKGALRYLAKYK